MAERRKTDVYSRVRRLKHDDPVLVEHYADIIAVFPAAVIVKKNDVVRFAQRGLARFFCDAGVGDIEFDDKGRMTRKPARFPGAPTLNDVWAAYMKGEFTFEDLMLFYQDIGYSLSGYLDIFSSEVTRMYKAGLCLLPSGDVVRRGQVALGGRRAK